jgi:hypothetical protein
MGDDKQAIFIQYLSCLLVLLVYISSVLMSLSAVCSRMVLLTTFAIDVMNWIIFGCKYWESCRLL